MKERNSFLLLLELMASILIFFLAASICLLVFSDAHKMNRASLELSAAVLVEKNIAELIGGSGDLRDAGEKISGAYPQASFSHGSEEETDSAETGVSLVIPFDRKLQPVREKGVYQLRAQIAADGGMIRAEMHFYPVDTDGKLSGDSVYDLTVRNVAASAEDTSGP